VLGLGFGTGNLNNIRYVALFLTYSIRSPIWN